MLAHPPLLLRIARIMVCSLLAVGGAAQAFTLEFPGLDLASTPDDVREWARQHEFAPVTATPPMDAAFQKDLTDTGGGRQVLSFAEGSPGLKMLSLDQLGILNATAAVRRNIIQRFGEPSADQILPGQTLRITYQLDQPESARRIFLVSSNSLSMLLVTDDYFAELQRATAEEERAEHTAARAAQKAAEAAEAQAAAKARNAWLAPVLWIVGIGLGWIAFLRLAPEPIRRPVVRVVGTMFGFVYNLANETFFQLFPIAVGIAQFAGLILSGLAVFVGPIELGTSWWWVLLWLAGLAIMYKSHEDGSLKTALLSVGLYLAGFFGVMLELWLSGG